MFEYLLLSFKRGVSLSFWEIGGSSSEQKETKEDFRERMVGNITDQNGNETYLDELARQYAGDLEISSDEVLALLREQKREFSRPLSGKGREGQEVERQMKSKIAELYTQVIVYQLEEQFKRQSGKFIHDKHDKKIYFKAANPSWGGSIMDSDSHYGSTYIDAIDIDTTRRLGKMGVSIKQLVEEANKRHAAQVNEKPNVSEVELYKEEKVKSDEKVQEKRKDDMEFGVWRKKGKGFVLPHETPDQNGPSLHEVVNDMYKRDEQRAFQVQQGMSINAIEVDSHKYERAERFYVDYTPDQMTVVNKLFAPIGVQYTEGFTEDLYKAVVWYQRQNGLDDDGMAGVNTIAHKLPINTEMRVGYQNYYVAIEGTGRNRKFVVTQLDEKAIQSIYPLGLSRAAKEVLDEADLRVNKFGVLTRDFQNGYKFLMDTRSLPKTLGEPVGVSGVDSPDQAKTVYEFVAAVQEHARRYESSKNWIERKYTLGSIEMQALHALFPGHIGATMEVTPYLYDAIIREQVRQGSTGKGVDGMPGKNTLEPLIPREGKIIDIDGKKYLVKLVKGKPQVETVGEAKLNGTTLHVTTMDAYIGRQVQENSYKLLGQYATIMDDSVAIGALQVLLGAERTGVFDTQTVVAVFKNQAQLGYVIPEGENHTGRVLDGTLSSRFLLDAVTGTSVSVENGLCTFAMSHGKLVHYIDGNKENLTPQQLEQNAQVDFYDMFPTELQRWYIQGLLGVQQTGYWTTETYQTLQKYAYQHNARLYLTKSQVGNLYGAGGVKGDMPRGNVFLYEGNKYSVHLIGKDNEKVNMEVRGLGDR